MNQIDTDALLEKIKAETGCQPEVYQDITDEDALCIPVENLEAVIGVLRKDFGCYHLSGITAQQRESQPGKIELIYHFWHGKGVSLLLRLPADDPKVASIIALLPGADFYEREAAEMYGITFTGREETPRLLLPDEWDQGPPFLKREASDG
ncbi:MAG: NADH-quinone oxidoreductase subunit C [Brevefilum sp.]|nr:NADH-quinone oxidoreductase subunit C [Brevefilum sp.]